MAPYSDFNLRFDDHEASLGDEMRGARATKGVPLSEIERLLKIRAHHLVAIEDGRLADLPGPAYISGFVRSYARFLGMEPDEAWRRFQKSVGPVETTTDLADPAKVERAARMRGEGGSQHLRGGGALDTLARQRRRSGLSGAVSSLGVVLLTLLTASAVAWGAWGAFKTLGDADLLPQILSHQGNPQTELIYGLNNAASDGFGVAPPLEPEAWSLSLIHI